MKFKLVCSCAVGDSIESMIAQYFYGEDGDFKVDGEKVIRISDNKTLDHFRVITKKGRIRFERVTNN